MSSGDAEARLAPGRRHALPDARRATADRLRAEVELVAASPIVAALVEAVDATLLVLNAERQVVAANGPRGDRARLAGLRPGEVLACVNARSPGGCGTTAACETCGALGAILTCERSRRTTGADCHLATGEGGPTVELEVRASPVTVDGQPFTVVSLRDVSVARRREALEQLFFHDLLNTVAGVRGWAQNLGRAGADAPRAAARLESLSRQLEREIRDHRALVLAEEGSLVAAPAPVEVADLAGEVAALFAQHAAGRERRLEVEAPPGLRLETDRNLLARVLINMVRNALEAAPPGGTVRLACEEDAASGTVTFRVHNAGAIPPEVQARIFQRSFSTKGRGRGFGTYGMRLLGERYLGGRVTFTSTADAGTTFTLALPARAAGACAPAWGPGPAA